MGSGSRVFVQSDILIRLNILFQGSNRLKTKAETTTHEVKDDTLLNRLKACLMLQSVYRDALRSLRDALGASQNLSHFTSLSSISGPPPSVGGRSVYMYSTQKHSLNEWHFYLKHVKNCLYIYFIIVDMLIGWY